MSSIKKGDDLDNDASENEMNNDGDESSEKLCDACKQKMTETQLLEKKFKKLKKLYANLCVRFAELKMQYDDLIKSNSVSESLSQMNV